MPSLRSLFIIAALAAASFGLGYWIGGHEDREVAFDLDHAAEVLLSASRASTRRGQAETLVPVLMRMQPADFEALAPVVESTFGVGGGGRAMQLFVERWASLDAPGADVRVKAWPPDRRREVLPGLLRSWVRVDPVAALAALDAVEDANHRVLAFEGLVEGWADSGDPAVWDYLAGLEEGKRRRKALIVVMHQIAAKEGLDALRERVEALPGEPPQDRFKNEALNWAADVMVRIDLQQAVAFATACEQGPYCNHVTTQAAIRWSTEDGPATMAWLRSLPAAERRDLAMYGAYSSWLRQDRMRAAEWLETQGEAADLAPMFRSRAKPFARSNLRLAVKWASEIEDPELRRLAQIEIGRVWRRKDDVAAERWLVGLGLSEEVPYSRRPPGRAVPAAD